MSSVSPKPQDDKTAATGASEAEAARQVKFEPGNSGKDEGRKDRGDDPPDAAEKLGTKRRDGEKGPDDRPPSEAVSARRLTTETDDGAS